MSLHSARHPHKRVAVQRIQHRAKGGFDLNVLAARALGDLARQMGQERLRPLPPQIGGTGDHGP